MKMKLRFNHVKSPWGARPAPSAGRPVTSRKMIVAGALMALLLAGCSAGDSSEPSSDPAVGGTSGRDSTRLDSGAPETQSGVGAPSSQGDVSKTGSAVVTVGPKLTKSASVDLRVKDVSVAAARVRSIATGLQAQVLSEQLGKGGSGDPQPLPEKNAASTDPGVLGGFGTLTLSVPADKLDLALDQLSKIGTVLQRATSSQDVTAQYVDTESRLKTMRASVARVRALMTQAKDLGQVVVLESELSRRQADLESLESQLAALKTSVERSTLSVTLSTPGSEPVEDNGFLAGLRAGWDAFTASAAGLFKAFGAVLPFAVFVALVALPLWWWWRRHEANKPPHAPAPAAPTASAATGPAAPGGPTAP